MFMLLVLVVLCLHVALVSPTSMTCQEEIYSGYVVAAYGSRGPPGAPGYGTGVGYQGTTGAQGGTGAPGPRGEQGPPGPKGDKGDSDVSAIEALRGRIAALEAQTRASVEIVRRYVKFSSRGATGPYVSAKAECASLKGHVALPRSAAENKEVLKLVQRYGKKAWLGSTDSKYEGAFWDRNGQLIVYSQWVPGQPDNYLGNEHCVDMDTNGEWSDSRCDLYHIIICEIPNA